MICTFGTASTPETPQVAFGYRTQCVTSPWTQCISTEAGDTLSHESLHGSCVCVNGLNIKNDLEPSLLQPRGISVG